MALFVVLTAGALIIGFFLWERRSRQNAEAKSFVRGVFDRGSTTLLAVVFTLGFVLLPLSFVLNTRGIGRIGVAPGVAWGGIVVILLGRALRIWASRVLGRFFTQTLRVTADQPVASAVPIGSCAIPATWATC